MFELQAVIGFFIVFGILKWVYGSPKIKDAEPPPDNFGMKEVPFGPTDPKTFDEYKGQERVKRLLKLTLDTVFHNPHPKLLLVAPKGVGKTALAKIFAHAYLQKLRQYAPGSGRYIELVASTIRNKADLDNFMRRLRLWDVVFMDEVHLLRRRHADTLLTALAENRYPFAEGMSELPVSFVWLAATTDVGLLPEAFRDRFQVIKLDHLDIAALTEIAMSQDLPVAREAAREIAVRAVGYPREIKRVYARARDVALQAGSSEVTLEHAQVAFDLIGLDSNGLYPEDYEVLKVLYEHPKFYAPRKDGTRPMRYAQSERVVRALTGMDESLYRDSVEPKLLRLGLITVSSAGRELTDKGLALVKSLRKTR